jgi:Xaa-Pro aminopeptidase
MRKRTHTVADCDTTAYTTILTLNGHGKHTTRTGIQRVHPTFENHALHHHTKPLLLLDMGARYGGYCADITRTFSTTTPTNRQIDIYRSVLTLYELGESMVKPGVLYEDIDRAVMKQLVVELKRLGFSDYTNTYKYMPHSLGHSVGIEVHDTPDIMSVGRLRTNMVLTIEPGIYTDEMDIRIENTIVVTEGGCRVLSNGVPWSMKWFCRGSR